jgi:hypothetical protein
MTVLVETSNNLPDPKEDEIGRACSTHRGEEDVVENPEGKTLLVRTSRKWWILLKLMLDRTECYGLDSSGSE